MKRGLQVFIRSIQRLSFKKIMMLLRLNFRHPLFSILSFYATLKTFALAQKYFPKTHSGDGVGNAFRHALWSCLILMYCCKISSPKKALAWCKRMTDLHEILFPNNALETKMDLHNNQVGMNIFMQMLPGIHRQFFETSFFVDVLIEKTKTAKVLSSLDKELGDELVYLDETSL